MAEAHTNWLELIEDSANERDDQGPPIRMGFNPPTTKQHLSETESALGTLLPDELRSLLSSSNGVRQLIEIAGKEQSIGDLIWSVERIREENRRFRSSPEYEDAYMPFDSLLYFADAGNGDCFAYAVAKGQVVKNDILVWNHEDDSRRWVAPSLSAFLKGWASGKIRV